MENYGFVRILIYLNLFEHYPALLETFPSLYQYFQFYINSDPAQLFDFQQKFKANLATSPLIDYCADKIQQTLFPKFDNWYQTGPTLMKLFYIEQKINQAPNTTLKTWTYLTLLGEVSKKLIKSPLGKIIQLNGFQSQTLKIEDGMKIIKRAYHEFGIIFKIKLSGWI